MQIEVVYHDGSRRVSSRVKMPEGASIRDALERVKVTDRVRDLDLSKQKVGVFGKVKKLDVSLSDGDRVEIYRPITCDPETVPRRDQ